MSDLERIGAAARRIAYEIVFGDLDKAYVMWDIERKGMRADDSASMRDLIKSTVAELDAAKLDLDVKMGRG